MEATEPTVPGPGVVPGVPGAIPAAPALPPLGVTPGRDTHRSRPGNVPPVP